MNHQQDYLETRIAYLKKLPSVGPNWSGPGDCAAPKEVSCERAIAFIRELGSICSTYKLQLPELTVGPRLDGDIEIDVDTPNRLFYCTFTENYIEISFNEGVAHISGLYLNPTNAAKSIFDISDNHIKIPDDLK